MKTESYVARRKFLGCMIGGGAVTLGAGFAGPVTSYVGNLREVPPPPFLELPQEDWDLEPGTSKMIAYGSKPAMLIMPPTSSTEGHDLKVFLAECTHLDCTVGYLEGTEKIFCACHDGYFDLNGNVLSGPPPAPLREFFHKQVGDKLVIALEKEHLEKALQESDT